jgi:DNA-binding SARP family transcriptional activator
MDRLRLTLLGSFALHDEHGRVLRLPTRKAEALLAYLALAGRGPLRRDHLAALLWSGADAAAALASLRQCLSLIGKACGPGWVQGDGRDLQLAAARFTVDVPAFEAALADVDLDTLAAVGAAYRGELLAGLALDEVAFDDWLQARRQRLHEQALRLFERLGDGLQAAGRIEPALQATLRLLELDPLHEQAHRRLMQLQASLGRRSAALRQYQVCVDVLRRELGTEPEPATRRLYHELLRMPAAQAGPAHGPQAAAAARPVHESPLVGRADELAALLAALDAARAGEGRLVLLLGEAGVGKTRLGDELAARAQDQGLRVLVGRCHESQRLLPLAPWTEALRLAGVAADGALLEALAPWRADLASLLPELAPAAPPPPHEGSALARQARLFEALIQLLARLASGSPTLLLVEDLHWADAPSMGLLGALARRAGGWPLMLVASARQEELAASPRLQQILRELDSAPAGAMRLQRLPLQPLGREHTRRLVQALRGGGAGPVDNLDERVWAISEGNPLVVVEAVRAAQASPGEWRASAPTLPERVRELILGQVQRLSPAARRVLALVALAGRETELPVLQDAAGLDLPRAAETLEELVRRRLLCLVGDAFDFSHARVRQAVSGTLLAPMRAAHHLALAQAIDALPEGSVAARTARLAFHYAQTDHHADAALHLGRQAQDAAHGGAHAQALELLAQARQHAARLPAAQAAALHRELLLRQARSLFFLGRFAELLERLVPEQAAIDAAGDPRTAAAFYLRLGSTRTYLGDHAGAVRDAQRALAEAASCDDSPTMGKAHFLLSLERFWDQPERGVWHGEQALQHLAGSGETWWTGQACWILGLNLSYRGRLTEGLAMEARAAVLADESADRRLASYAAWTTGFIHALAGDLDAALQACRRSVELALDPLNRMTSLGILSLTLVERRETDEALQHLAEAIAQAVQFRIPQMHGLFLAFRAEAERLRGQLGTARASVAAALSTTHEAGYRYGEGWAQRVAARIEHAAGDRAAALQHIARALQTFDGMGAPYEAARTRLEQALWLEQDGQLAAALAGAAAADEGLSALGLPLAAAARSCRTRLQAGLSGRPAPAAQAAPR